MPKPLSAVAVTNAKAIESRREIADGAAPGLRLVVQTSGSKSWAFRYERPGGKAVKVTLGPAVGQGALSLADARQLVSDMRRGMSRGLDPADEQKAKRASIVADQQAALIASQEQDRRAELRVGAVLDRYIARHVDHLKSAREVRRLLDREVRPKWAEKLVSEVTRRDVVALVVSIAERGAGITANRVLANVRAWLGWCIEQGLIEASPAERMRLPTREAARERVLSDAEITCLAKSIACMDWPWRQFFTTALLTAQRREEIAGMRWAELDLGSSEPTWLLPSSRTKNGREHAVPLSSPMVELLRNTPRIKDSPLVFTTTGITAVSGFSRAKATLDGIMTAEGEAGLPWRLHDLRRTAASGMARLGASVPVVEKVLNHVSGTFGGIVGVYQRHDFAAEKREALSLWADHVQRLKSEA